MAHNTLFLEDQDATESFGALLAHLTGCRGLITLSGELGSGKTTLSRGLIHAAGHLGAVKSPTYTLVEPYVVNGKQIMHFDLYRLQDPEELEFLGFRDYLEADSLCLIEWPEKAGRTLPQADLSIRLEVSGAGRQVCWQGAGEYGRQLSEKLDAHFAR